MNNVAVIPARGGSKGIEKKNIVPFQGAPLLAHTIEQALTSDSIDDIYVSTDADDITAIGREYGATVIDRPAELAGDTSATEEAMLHALETIREWGADPDHVILLQCTSPLRRPTDIDDAVRLVTKAGFDSALSCSPSHDFLWRTTSEGAEPVNYDPKDRSMRQEIDGQYTENGSVYVIRTELLEREQCRLGGRIGIHEMPPALSLEIDTPDDLEIVSCIAETTDHDVQLASASTTP